MLPYKFIFCLIVILFCTIELNQDKNLNSPKAYDNVVLGFQHQSMTSETKDKFFNSSIKMENSPQRRHKSYVRSVNKANTPSISLAHNFGVSSSLENPLSTKQSKFSPNHSVSSADISKLMANSKIDGNTTHFHTFLKYSQDQKVNPKLFGYQNKYDKQKYRRMGPYKPTIGTYGIDNLQLANKALYKNNEQFNTTNQEYTWIKPMQY